MNSRVLARLDWNKMLGFEQITEARESIRNEAVASRGAKVGTKVGNKVGNKVGAKIGVKTGLKS